MESNQQNDYLTNSNNPQTLPNATLSLVLGILSIVLCGPGLILGIIGIVMANKDIALYNQNPGTYSEGSFNNTKSGKICSVIGVILSGLVVLVYGGVIIFALLAANSIS